MYYVYVLKSLKNDRFYTGSTQDLQKRLMEHNSGRSKSTRLTKPYKLVYYETVDTRSGAVQREKHFKSGKGREELKRLLEGH